MSAIRPIRRVLVANRGEIAIRVLRACRELGVETVAVHSDVDRNARHVIDADQAVEIGAAAASASYLRGDAIIEAARKTGADAVHPGFGFLSENADFAQAVIDAGLAWIGPQPDVIRLMGSKVEARRHMRDSGVPVVPGYEGTGEDADLVEAADGIGYPLLVKASAGGGGRGMRAVDGPEDLAEALAGARREAGSAFGDDQVYLEKRILRPRHVEVQVFGDAHGHVVHLYERECSVQRRHQKIIEESPSTAVNDALRARMGKAAVRAAQSVNYVGAGTVEFLLDEDGSFYFLEMNTRIQVEHPVTECITGTDLVAWQITVAEGNPIPLAQEDIPRNGHALECRLYAEDPGRGFLPETGTILAYEEPSGPGVRVDSGVREGDVISAHYDPMIAKIVVHAPDRAHAIARMRRALSETVLLGVTTNQDYLRGVLGTSAFAAGDTTTDFVEQHMADWPCEPDLADGAAVAVALFDVSGGAHPGVAIVDTDAFSPWRETDEWGRNG